MTKTFRFIGMVLMAVLVSVSFAACSDDDDDDNSIPTAAQMLNTTWKGSGNAWNGYSATVTFNSNSSCTVKVYDNKGNLDETETCEYSYNEATGALKCPDYGVTGSVRGNKMTLTSSDSDLGSFTMTKQ